MALTIETWSRIKIRRSIRLLNETVQVVQVGQINKLLGLKLLQLVQKFGVGLQLLESVHHHGIVHALKLIYLVEQLMILIQG